MADIELRPCLNSDVENAAALNYTSGPSPFDFVFKPGSITSLQVLKYVYQRKRL